MTATLISYVGVDTFWGLIVGFRLLMDEANRATTFNELRAAGERYGKVMGTNAARAFALLAMAALGTTAPGLPPRRRSEIDTQFKNSRSNTQSRIQNGRWVPENE